MVGAPSATLPDGAFGVRLDAALAARGLALERVCERLRAAGIPLSPSTLSLWRHGRSVPRRNEAMRAVAELESALQVPRGYLLDTLVRRPPARHWSASGEAEDPVRRVREELGLDEGDTVQRLLVHHRVRLDARRRVTSVRIRRVLRATSEPVSRIGITAHGTVGHPLHIVPRPGTGIGRQRSWDDRGLLFTELVLAEPIAPGELGTLDYLVEPPAPGEPSTGAVDWYGVHTEFPVSTTIVECRFDPRALPATAASLVRSRAAVPHSPSKRPVAVGRDGGATVVVHGLDEGSVRLEWAWDET